MEQTDYETFGKNILEAFLDQYNYLINKVYKYQLESSPDAFPTYKFLRYLDIKVILLDIDFFNSSVWIIISDNSKDDEAKFIDYSGFDLDELSRKYNYGSKFQAAKQFLTDQLPQLNDKSIKIINSYSESAVAISDSIRPIAKLLANEILEDEFKSYKKNTLTPVAKYQHDVISPFSHLDFDGIITKISDKDFEYQMRQAEECYKRALYLPAAATMGVCLETVLLLLIDKNNISTKSIQETMLNALGEALRNRNIINYRTNRRIEMAYSIRNSVSHSNTGSVAKTDCDLILNTIKSIVDEHF